MKFKYAVTLAVFLGLTYSQRVFGQSQSFFEIKIYHFETEEQENLIDDYLKQAYLPALNRTGIKTVGVFKPIGNDTLADKRIYVLIPFKSVNHFVQLPDKLLKDQRFKTEGKTYLQAAYSKPPYKRIESILTKAFSDMPLLHVPQLKNSPDKRVYELRSYEAYSEEIFKNKVEMFNEGGEVILFNRLGFNAVFYASVISGSKMPNLMYMTTFEDMASRDEHWKAFSNDPEWKRLSAMEKYQKNVSKIDILFLRPTDYSGI